MTVAKSVNRLFTRQGLLSAALVALVVPSIGSTVLTLAWFTDSESLDANAFTTGTIDVSTSPTTALLTASAMMPGDTVNGTLVVSNTGTAQLRYAVSTSATNGDSKALRDAIVLTIKTQGASCAAFDGTTLSTGALDSAGFGSNAPGAHGGDRTLNAGTSETLCFRATLPTSTGNAYQGATTTATFTFDGEQTANNP
jgi:hypothetical protein